MKIEKSSKQTSKMLMRIKKQERPAFKEEEGEYTINQKMTLMLINIDLEVNT